MLPVFVRVLGVLGTCLVGSGAAQADEARAWTYSVPGQSGYVQLQPPEARDVLSPRATETELKLDKTDFGWTAGPPVAASGDTIRYTTALEPKSQSYPGTPVFPVWKPASQEIGLPEFRSLAVNAQQPKDIYLNGIDVVNLEKYVPADRLKATWRVMAHGSDAEKIRAELNTIGISDAAMGQLTFNSVGATGLRVFDIDVRALNPSQREGLALVSATAFAAYAAQSGPKRYVSRLIVPISAAAQPLTVEKLTEYLLPSGIQFSFMDSSGEYISHSKFHISKLAQPLKEGLGIDAGAENNWIKQTIHVSPTRTSENMEVRFELADLQCRRAPADVSPSRLGEAFSDSCENGYLNSFRLGGTFANVLKASMGATKILPVYGAGP